MTDNKGGAAVVLLAKSLLVGGKRWMCLTNHCTSQTQWKISVSDGSGVWSVAYDEAELCRLADGGFEGKFIKDALNSSLTDGDVEIKDEIICSDFLTISIKTSIKQFQFNLSKLKDSHALSSLTFDLSAQLETTQQQLQDCRRKLEDAKLKTEKREQSIVVDATHSSVTRPGRAKRPAGGSLVNPGIKRRKAVKGVVFGNTSQDD